MEDPIQRYRTKSRDRRRERRNSLRSIERLQKEVYKTKQTISSATDVYQKEMNHSQHSRGRLSRVKASNAKVKPRSKSRDSRACSFDADEYYKLHSDLRPMNMKAGSCLRRTSPSTESLTGDSYQEDLNRRHVKQVQRDAHQRSSSRGRHRETNHDHEKNSAKQRSRSSNSIRSLRRKVQHLAPKRFICVDGAPFDKNGRCFVHNQIKLASKKLLGGWKIHLQYCPECARDYENEENISVISGVSGLSQGSISEYDDHSAASSVYHSDNSVKSSRSYSSIGSQRTWSSKHSRRLVDKNDDSFLPLDEDGCCLSHPDVQLAKMSRGRWNVLFDFCPACAEQTLIIGGPLPKPRRRPSHYSSRSSVASSVKSSRSTRSAESTGTFVESMPYIDGEARLGYYTGYVNADAKPSGRGKMKYDYEVWEGVWEEGTKIHGKKSVRKKNSSSRRHQPKHHHSRRDESRHVEQGKSCNSRSRHRNAANVRSN